MRGHGKSSKPDHGYRISRLAADLNALIIAESLDRITLLGHSMGCAVIWSYLELFGSSKIKKLVLVDQCAAIVFDPGWSDAKRRAAGSIFSADECFNTLNALHGPDGVKVTSDLLRSMTSDSFSEERSKLLLEQNLIMSRENAARLFYDHAFQDWTDVITRIDLPTLVIGAKGSLVPWQSLVAIGEMIKGATTVIFDIAEGGSHFLFLENQQKFLTIVEDFLEN
jgi:pimeloyl-ACP methyl ester carboxylesterase